MGSSFSSSASTTLDNETSKLEPHSSSTSNPSPSVIDGTKTLENQDQVSDASGNGEKGDGEDEKRDFFSIMREGACNASCTAWQNCLNDEFEKGEDANYDECEQAGLLCVECGTADPEHHKRIAKAFVALGEGGGCKDTFTPWADCVKETREDFIDKCRDEFSLLVDCMVAHFDHYGAPFVGGLKRGEEETEVAKKTEIKDDN